MKSFSEFYRAPGQGWGPEAHKKVVRHVCGEATDEHRPITYQGRMKFCPYNDVGRLLRGAEGKKEEPATGSLLS